MSSSSEDKRRLFVFNTDLDYFKNVEHDEGGPVVQYIRGSEELIKSWRPNDIALVWITQQQRVAAYYTITNIIEREDQCAVVESFDAESERPHRVAIQSDTCHQVTLLDLRRKSYEVTYQNSNKKVPMEVLSSPLKAPLPINIRWLLWKYQVDGVNMHFVDDGLKIKHSSSDPWYKKVTGAEREAILEEIYRLQNKTENKGKRKEASDPQTNSAKKSKSSSSDGSSRTTTKTKAPSAAPSLKSTPSKTTTSSKSTPSKSTTPSSKSVTSFSHSLPATFQRLVIGQGTNIAIRADHPDDTFVVAQVSEQVDITDIGTEKADQTQLPIRWFVECAESGLRGYYCFPNWNSTVEYGAVVKVGVRLSYVEDMDMWQISAADYEAIRALASD